MRLVLRAGFDRFSGYGNDAVDLAINLQRCGVDVMPWPLSILPGLPAEFTRLLEKDPGGPKDAVLQFSPPAEFRSMPEWADAAPRSFGYTMWERTPVTRRDLPWGRMPRRFSDHLTGLAVTCVMNVDAFKAIDPGLDPFVVPCGIESEDWPVAERVVKDRPMRFLMIGALGGRKDPFCVLDAWRWLKEAHAEFDAELVVHTFAPGLHPGMAEAYGPGITFSGRPLSRPELIELYHSCDVLVTASRGEGNNKPAMEFMATGGMVIASDWSGHQNWLHRDSTVALPGILTDVQGVPGVQEFVVDPTDVADAMLVAWRNPRTVRTMGRNAAGWIRASCGWDVVTPRLIRWMEKAG